MYDYFRYMYTSDPRGKMIEQENRYFLVLYNVYARRFQTYLELFMCGVCPLMFAASLPIFRERSRTPSHLPNRMKIMAAT